MRRTFSTSAAISVLALGFASAALAATGEYGSMDAMALAQGQVVKTDCSIYSQLEGKTYCFGSQASMTQFMQNPKRYIRKAQANYQNLQ
ncbi:MAG: YHS domain-containing protein [Hyphomicrobiales bacterium]